MKRTLAIVMVVLAFVACLWLSKSHDAFGGADRVEIAESDLGEAKVKLAVVNKSADVAGKVAAVVPREYADQTAEMLGALRDKQTMAVFEMAAAQRKLNRAKVEAGGPVLIATYTNISNSIWPRMVRTLLDKGIPVDNKYTSDGCVTIWVRKEDVPIAVELLSFPTNSED